MLHAHKGMHDTMYYENKLSVVIKRYRQRSIYTLLLVLRFNDVALSHLENKYTRCRKSFRDYFSLDLVSIEKRTL